MSEQAPEQIEQAPEQTLPEDTTKAAELLDAVEVLAVEPEPEYPIVNGHPDSPYHQLLASRHMSHS